jgi:cell division protein FtsB
MNFETFFKKAMIYLLIIVIIIFAFKLVLNMRKLNKMEDRLNNLQEQVQQEAQKNKELHDEIKKVKSPEYVEKVAREELGLVKPGEILFIPVEEDENQKDEKKDKQQSENE